MVSRQGDRDFQFDVTAWPILLGAKWLDRGAVAPVNSPPTWRAQCARLGGEAFTMISKAVSRCVFLSY